MDAEAELHGDLERHDFERDDSQRDHAVHDTEGSASTLLRLSSVREYDADNITVLHSDSSGLTGKTTHDETVVTRTAPRLAIQPMHTLIALLILLAALSMSLTLLLQQAIHISQNGGNQSTAMSSEPESMHSSDEDETGQTDGSNSTSTQTNDTSVAVPSEQPEGSQDGAQSANAASATPDSTDTRIDLNTASLEELQTISGVGPVMSQRIVEHRTAIGGYTSVDELLDVKGIGAKTLEHLRPLVKVN